MPGETKDRPTSADEAELMRDVQHGNTEAFEQLFARYSPKIYRQALHLLGNDAEAEEIMQEVFLTLYEKATTFRGDAAVSTWLYRLTANAAISRLRRRTQRQEVLIDDYLPQFQADGHHQERPLIDWSLELEQSLVRDEAHQLLRQAINALQPLDKAVVVLSDLEELSQRETGEILGLSVAAVKARLHRARLFLRGRLATSLGDMSS
jgi:RNA polymerase sigma-70 factor (ECF subfamily)